MNSSINSIIRAKDSEKLFSSMVSYAVAVAVRSVDILTVAAERADLTKSAGRFCHLRSPLPQGNQLLLNVTVRYQAG